jgi:hypothetical protein
MPPMQNATCSRGGARRTSGHRADQECIGFRQLVGADPHSVRRRAHPWRIAAMRQPRALGSQRHADRWSFAPPRARQARTRVPRGRNCERQRATAGRPRCVEDAIDRACPCPRVNRVPPSPRCDKNGGTPRFLARRTIFVCIPILYLKRGQKSSRGEPNRGATARDLSPHRDDQCFETGRASIRA